MKFILIKVFLINSGNTGGQGFAYQEFDSKESCEAAIVAAKDLAKSIKLFGDDLNKKTAFRCMKK